MFEKVKIKKHTTLGSSYDHIFENGTYTSRTSYNRDLLDILGVAEDKSKKLLDVGCGGGYLLREASQRVASYGIDISAVAVQEAKERAPDADISEGNAEKLSFGDSFFDYVTAIGTLEHFINMDAALQEMKRVLKPDGKLLLYLPNLFSLLNIYHVAVHGNIPTHGQENERFATFREWQRLIEKNGFEVIGSGSYTRPFRRKVRTARKPLKWAYNLVWRHIVPRYLGNHFTYVCVKAK